MTWEALLLSLTALYGSADFLLFFLFFHQGKLKHVSLLTNVIFFLIHLWHTSRVFITANAQFTLQTVRSPLWPQPPHGFISTWLNCENNFRESSQGFVQFQEVWKVKQRTLRFILVTRCTSLCFEQMSVSQWESSCSLLHPDLRPKDKPTDIRHSSPISRISAPSTEGQTIV